MATRCQARTAANVPCVASAKLFDGQREFCGTHHKVKLRTDPGYSARIEAFKADPELVAATTAVNAAETALAALMAPTNAQRRRAKAAVRASRQALTAAHDAARERQHPGVIAAERAVAVAAAAAVQARRDAIIAANAAHIAELQRVREQRLALHAAAVALRPAAAAANVVLVAALTAVVDAHALLHAAEAAHNAAPDDESAMLAVAAAVVEMAERRAAADAARAAAAEPLRLFNEANARWNAVARPMARLVAQPAAQPIQVFQRDPEGSINLRAFATDTQTVHRSSVVSAVEAAIHRLLERPLAVDQRTLVEATSVLPTPHLRTVLQHDYNMTGGFGVTYAKVLDHVWGTLRTHEHKVELERRFIEEIRDGIGMCNTGKMTRLVNVLAGFDDAVGDLMSPRELFQSRIALVAKQPLAERESAAKDLFREFAIGEDEQGVWLETLLEA